MSVSEKLEKVRRILQRDGVRGVASKVAQRASRRAEDYFSWPERDFPLRWEDVADSAHLKALNQGDWRGREGTQKMTVGWVCLPPAAGSGGHTTLFRMVEAMENRGHTCVIYLYDRDSEDVERHAQTIRAAWPHLCSEIRSCRPSIDGVDAVVASSWETAHVIANRADPAIKRFYFVQDYEPFFYPRGPLWELAEDTYRFGFNIIALGRMVENCIETFAGVKPGAVVPFGCDTDLYRDVSSGQVARTGVVFYAKKLADRRGYWLAKESLELFHRKHPEQEIHLVGDVPTRWSVPVTVHGTMKPAALNDLYNQCLAGLALSFTNVSLAPEEMLSAGVIPVVNESPMARLCLSTAGPVWVSATPLRIAQGLSQVVEMDESELAARRRGASIPQGWGTTAKQVVDYIETSTKDETRVAAVASATVAGSVADFPHYSSEERHGR